MSEWIPCKDRLPEEGVYLVTGQIERDWYLSEPLITMAGFDDEFGWTANGGSSMTVKAWQPLPELYKGD